MLEAVAFINELRREEETDLDRDDGFVSAFLLSVLDVVLGLLLVDRSETDAAPLSRTADFLGCVGPSDCRLVLATFVTLRLSSFSGFVDTEALLSHNGFLGTPVELRILLVFISCLFLQSLSGFNEVAALA